jgi:hypothetical protein
MRFKYVPDPDPEFHGYGAVYVEVEHKARLWGLIPKRYSWHMLSSFQPRRKFVECAELHIEAVNRALNPPQTEYLEL